MRAIHALALLLALHLRTSSGFSFTINNTPQQCSDLTISIIGSGQPPYSAVLVPYGALPNDAREVMVFNFSGGSTSTSFKLTYPENSQFVAVVSDSTGFGTGGASIGLEVQTSGDSSCVTNVPQDWSFSLTPDNHLTQCTSTRIYWDVGTTAGSVQFYGIIPGGQCFPLSEGPFTTVSGYGYGFECTVPVQAGTTVLLIGGDSRGIGTGGWAPMVVEQSNSQSCLDSSSPSSTPGSPAGSSPTSSSGVYSTSPSGVYPTSSSGVGNNTVNGGNGSSRNDSSSKSNKAAIIGGAAGGGLTIIAINVLLCLCFIRRRRHTRHDSPIDLLRDNVEPHSPSLNQIPHSYQQDVFRAPHIPTMFSHGQQNYDPHQSTEASTTPSLSRTGLDVTAMSPSYVIQNYDSYQSMQTDRASFPRHSGSLEPGGLYRGSTSSGSSPTQNSSPILGQMYPVHLIHHIDAGTVSEGSAFPEPLEFPPAYSNIQHSLPQ